MDDPSEWLARIDRIIESMPDGDRNAAFCFAEGTPPEIIAAFYAAHPELAPPAEDGGPRYQLANRWSGGSQGDPRALTWSFVPDGLSVGGSSSTLFSSMDAKFGGNRALWISKFQACFDRWQALTGITYTRKKNSAGNDWDDNASWGSAGGTYRGDIRIAMIYVDGGGGVLAYNYLPDNGDMVLDSAESWQSSANDYRFLRNVVMHENGHGIGLYHICPAVGSWLMEPYLSTSFDGPRHDDIRGGQRHYGDPQESDNTYLLAYNLGTLAVGAYVLRGPTPTPIVTNGSVLSIDADGETDWFKFTVDFVAKASVTVTPKGLTYDSSTQNPDGSCNSGNNVNSLAIANLNFQIIASDGSTVIATANSQPAGSTETLTNVSLGSNPGTFYIKVYEGDSPTQSQLYWLELTVQTGGADTTPPTPNPMTFATPPAPSGATPTTAINMVATQASDPTTPIHYALDANTGPEYPGADSRDWSTARAYSDTDLTPNTSYVYRARARDGAFNETSPSADASATTYIETPTGVSFGTVTNNSIVLNAAGTLTNLTVGMSGAYFDSTTAGGNGGINEWVQTPTDTATGLGPNTSYTFQVKARNQNSVETAYSPTAAKVTLANVPLAPTLANPTETTMTLDVNANGNPAVTVFAVQCTTAVPNDANWVGRYVIEDGTSSADAVWRTDAAWGVTVVQGLQPATTYTFAVKARNQESVETAFGPGASLATTGGALSGACCYPAAPCAIVTQAVCESGGGVYQGDGTSCTPHLCCLLMGDMNGDTYVNGADIQGFVDVMLAGFHPCADLAEPYDTLDAADVTAFATLLLGP